MTRLVQWFLGSLGYILLTSTVGSGPLSKLLQSIESIIIEKEVTTLDECTMDTTS